MFRLCLAISRAHSVPCRHIESFRGLWRSSWLSETRFSLHQPPMIAPVGRRSQPRSNPLSEIWLLNPALHNQPISVPNAVEHHGIVALTSAIGLRSQSP